MARIATLLALIALTACLAQAAPEQQYVYDLPAETSFAAAAESYKGQKVIRVENPSRRLLDGVASADLDIFGRGAKSIDIRIRDSGDLDKVKALSGSRDLRYKVVVNDLQELVDKDAQDRAKESAASSTIAAAADPHFADYRPYSTIVSFLRGQCTAKPGVCEFKPSIGKTVLGRDIAALKIGTPGTGKASIFIEGMLHAREWVASSTVQYIAWRLLQEADTNATVKDLLSKVDIHIVPTVNSDGYEYSRSTSRLWRKNRATNSDGTRGVDLNRNFAYNWNGNSGSSRTPSSDTYRGPSVESEPETKAISNYVRALPSLVAAVDTHCFSQLILRPWGDTTANAPHEAQHKAIGDAMSATIRSVSGRSYVSQKGMDLYATIGTMSDWAYLKRSTYNGATIVPYGITIELRPGANASNGFVLPKEQIVPTGEEIYPAFLQFAANAVRNPLRV